METRAFGPTGLQVPVVGQGTWNMERDGRERAVVAIRRALDLGLSHLDTAEMYGDGEVERLVGEAIQGRRHEVFLASKVLPQNATFSGTFLACERSLRRLSTDRLDLYLLHWPGPHPLGETFAAFERLVEQGKVRFFGVSNFDALGLERAVLLAGEGKVACNQVLYHLGERYAEGELAAACGRHGVALVAYSPLFAGHFPGPETPEGQLLAAIGRVHGASAFQVALAFLVGRAGTFAIPKAATPEHVEQNAVAAGLRLAPEEIASIERAFPRRERESLPVL